MNFELVDLLGNPTRRTQKTWYHDNGSKVWRNAFGEFESRECPGFEQVGYEPIDHGNCQFGSGNDGEQSENDNVGNAQTQL